MLTQEDIAKLKTEHGEIWHVKGALKGDPPMPAWEIVFKKPSRADYKMFRANNSNPARKPDSQEILLRACIVSPAKDQFDALLNRFPGIPEADAVSEALVEALGLESDETEKH